MDAKKRAELRTVKAELATLPQWSVEGLTCYLLLLLHPISSPSPTPAPSADSYIRALPPSLALTQLLPFVRVVVDSEALQRQPRLFVDLARGWLEAVGVASLSFGEDGSEQVDAASWMLAECVTTSLMQGWGVGSATSPSLLSTFLPRFAPPSRARLVQQLIVQCPYPAVQAVLISGLKELALPSPSSPSSPPPLTSSALATFLLSLLPTLTPPSSPPLTDPLIATLNLFRFLLLRPPPQHLPTLDRQQLTVGVRVLQKHLMDAAEAAATSDGGEDLSAIMLRDLLVRVLELN